MQDFILADHKDFLVVYKPEGQDFHDSDGCLGFFNSLQSYYSGNQLWPVHRLDKVTSGLLLVAKNKDACRNLCDLFSSHNVEKTYLAIATGKPKKKQGTIKGDMERARRGSWKLLRSQANPAVTQFDTCSIKPGLRAYFLHPKTGKTHQLRVAMKSLGTPILGDSLYGGEESDRTYLHAAKLAFEYDGQPLTFTCVPRSGAEFLSHDFINAISGL